MKNKKVGLIILDGYGYDTKAKETSAIYLAKHPTIDKLLKTCPYSILHASQGPVGLPTGQMGNSEVGHLNIGAGRTCKTDLVRINEDIANKTFAKNSNLLKAIELAKSKNVIFHVIGLTSHGGVHASLDQILEVIKICGQQKVNTILHCITDGRDVDPKTFIKDIKEVLKVISAYPNVQLGSIGGRYYGMDRNENWDRVNEHIKAIMYEGKTFTDPITYIEESYKNDKTDEFIIPAANDLALEAKFHENDVIFFANFRPDRARQLSHCIKKSNLYKINSKLWNLHLTLVTMVKYDGIDSDIILYPPEQYANTLGKVLETNNLKQLRIAETEKYAHVTFFFDGGKDFNYKNEKKILVKSPDVATYDLKPEMSAYEVCDQLIQNMDKFDVIICNFANCDMVGHTGKMDATIKAVETVDKCLEKIIKKADEIGMTLFITADHGNADLMLSNGKPVTTHSLADVFFICTDKSIKLSNGSLGNISPTILKYLDIPKPKEMTKDSLF